VGKRGSIAVIERFHRTLKEEMLRDVLVPYATKDLRQELAVGIGRYHGHRPHMALEGRTPREAYRSTSSGRKRGGGALARTARGGTADKGVRLRVPLMEGRKHLPVVRLERAA